MVETCMFLGAEDSNTAQVTLNNDNLHCSYVLLLAFGSLGEIEVNIDLHTNSCH